MRKLAILLAGLAPMLVATAAAFASGHRAHASATKSGRCSPDRLVTTVSPPSAASGRVGLILRFVNNGPPCTLRGFPRVYGLSAQGRTTVQAQPTLVGSLPGGTAVTSVTLPRGGTASALLQGVDPSFLERACPTYGFLEVAAPGTKRFVRFPSGFSLCELQIRPVVAGPSGRPQMMNSVADYNYNYRVPRPGVSGSHGAVKRTAVAHGQAA